jgi:hypothetical protein
MTTLYTFHRGETIQLALDLLSGTVDAIAVLAARIRPLPPGQRELKADAPVVANFTITSRAAGNGFPAGWTLTLSAADSLALAAGFYAADARLSAAGGIVTAQTVTIRLLEPATLP